MNVKYWFKMELGHDMWNVSIEISKNGRRNVDFDVYGKVRDVTTAQFTEPNFSK